MTIFPLAGHGVHQSGFIEIRLRKLAKLIAERGLSIEISEGTKNFSPARATTRLSARGHSNARCKWRSSTRSPIRLLEGKFRAGYTVFFNLINGKLDLSLDPEPMSVRYRG